MDERSALAATALEAFETAEPRSPSWSDADRAWADRVGLDASSAEAPLDDFVAVRVGCVAGIGIGANGFFGGSALGCAGRACPAPPGAVF